ncbi:MAG: methyltransferase domain-containing protein [Verrucomicrobiota bacterium]
MKEHTEYEQNVRLELVRRLKKEFRGLRMLEFGSGNGELARHLEKMGNQVTAVEAFQFAFDKIACTQKIHGTALSLPFIRDSFDCFTSVDVLEHLTENDVRIVIREAARLAKSIFVSVCTRPSGLLGPNGENLHLTVRPDSWWKQEFEKYFTVLTSPGYGVGQLVLEGKRKANYFMSLCDFGGVQNAEVAKQNDFYLNLFTQSNDWSQAKPNEDDSARWQQIEPLVKEIARSGSSAESRSAFRILDLGCGRGWLTNLLSQFGTAEGVEPVSSVIEHARSLFPNLQFTAGDAKTILSREDFSSYDLVVSSEVIEHVTDKVAFAADLKRLLKPDGHLILTTPRGESLNEWTFLFGDPSQPVEEWMTEPQLKEVFTEAGFRVCAHQRVWFNISERKFTDASSVETSDNLIAIDQIWKFQLSEEAKVETESPAQILSQFHFASRAAAEFALKKLPDHPALLTAHGTALAELGELELARLAAIQAVALHPDFLPARELFVKILRQLGREGEAQLHEARVRKMREKISTATQANRFSFLDHLAEAH